MYVIWIWRVVLTSMDEVFVSTTMLSVRISLGGPKMLSRNCGLDSMPVVMHLQMDNSRLMQLLLPQF